MNFCLSIDFFGLWLRKVLINLGFKVLGIIIVDDFVIGFGIWFDGLLRERRW